MNKLTSRTIATFTLLLGHAAWVPQAQAAVSDPFSDAVPPNAQTKPARPAIMLNMSKDHQLFYRAYNEYTDYDGDGLADRGYLHSLSYSGYFDSKKCYSYNNSVMRFTPTAMADSNNYCNGTTWNGNFLNWATMTRIDIVRKVLYGGLRSTDDPATGGTSLTVLERASLPMDAHSFAKYYKGDNINQLTPFNETEITICNTTRGVNTDISSYTTKPPLLRAARGNFALWNTHARRQCRWDEETLWGMGLSYTFPGDTDASGSPHYENDGFHNGNTGYLGADNDYPSRSAHALDGGDPSFKGDFVVRVEVCASGLLGTERCKKYPQGNYKPIGLLHEYGESNNAEFGLMTGSFNKNISGGVLRKNLSTFTDEINASNGTFTSTTGIVHTLNKLRIWGYKYTYGLYTADSGFPDNLEDNCNFGATELINGRCSSWGNPIGEMFTESLRYLKGPTSSGSYGPAAVYGGPSSDNKGAAMGLPQPAWTDPFDRGATIDNVFGAPQCRPISIINFNASIVSHDNNDQSPFLDLGAAKSLNEYTDDIGSGELINNSNRFVGRVGGVGDNSCTGKFVDKLSKVDGLCPTSPSYQGSFSVAGAAYWAHTNPIRDHGKLTSNLYGLNKDPNFRVDTYSVALAPGVPRIEISAPAGKAIIQPSLLVLLDDGSGNLVPTSGALVDFRIIDLTATSGEYLIVWEDSSQGGDYDQDYAGTLKWSLAGNTLSVSTRLHARSTPYPAGFGYTISGTNRDGSHYHSGSKDFSFTDPTNLPVIQVSGNNTPPTELNASGGCDKCTNGNRVTQATYTITGSPAGVLEDPLFYAAKWGGFTFASGGTADTPDSPAKWDALTSEGLAGSDGVPDNYFLIFNPDRLEEALSRVLGSIVTTANASPAVSARQLTQGAFKYVAEYDQSNVSGDVKAYKVGTDGKFPASPTWRVGQQVTLQPPENRQIITNEATLGLSFDWSTLNARSPTTYLSILKGASSSTPLSDADTQDLVNYLRGDRTREKSTPAWRIRPDKNIVGPIVNAAPWIQTRPLASYFDHQFPDYSSFVLAHKSREQLLWSASNDGMVHGVRADTGAPVLSYVPGMLAPRLRDQIKEGLGVISLVDGSPFTGDVSLQNALGTSDWRTYLFGSLGRGGRGVYALDVTKATALKASEASSIFKWQFTADDDADLGYVLSDISMKRSSNQAAPIAKLNNGQFAILMGNGHKSTNGKAALMILPVDGPDSGGIWTNRYHKLVAEDSGNNGLSTPTWVDLDNNGTADVVYAGDLKGNLWKFDINNADPSKWRVAYGSTSSPAPLFIAKDDTQTPSVPLPISAAPEVTFPAFGGVMVTFATGVANTTLDFPRNNVKQRIYGIWDRVDFAAPTSPRALPRVENNTLVEREYARGSDGKVTVRTPATAIDYVNTLNPSDAKDGWYADLVGDSEMVVSNPTFSFGNIFMVSIRPTSSSTCNGLPASTLYAFDPVTGLPKTPLFGQSKIDDVTHTTVGVPIKDQKVTYVIDATGRATDYGSAPNTQGRSMALRVTGDTEDISINFNLNDARIHWREIPGLRTFER